jgi:hypothetical protein
MQLFEPEVVQVEQAVLHLEHDGLLGLLKYPGSQGQLLFDDKNVR